MFSGPHLKRKNAWSINTLVKQTQPNTQHGQAYWNSTGGGEWGADCLLPLTEEHAIIISKRNTPRKEWNLNQFSVEDAGTPH